MLCIIPAQPVMAQEKAYIYMDTLKPVKSGQYTGNEGDSFVYTIGQHQYTRGNTDIYGNSYTHGIEAWIARWNYTPKSAGHTVLTILEINIKNWRQNWS